MCILYFDCFSGIAGDMTSAALLSLAGGERDLRKALRGLPLTGFRYRVETAISCGMAGTRVDVVVPKASNHGHRHLPEITALLKKSSLPSGALSRALRAFDVLADAEAKVHGTTPDKVHFHEVGAVDAIVDIAAACFLFDRLGAPRTFCSALPGGSGVAHSEHGKIPVPGPATLAILIGAPWRFGQGEGELVTPTGAALLRAFDASFEQVPEMTVTAVGTGVGHKEFKDRPNIVRAILGEERKAVASCDRILQIEANVDDMSPQRFELLIERSLQAGAVDVAIVPATMKKNRPGWIVRVLASEERLEIVSAALFSISTTIGLRYHSCDRITLTRRTGVATTKFGPVRVKEVDLPGGGTRALPEYDDVKRIVKAGKATFDDVYAEVARSWQKRG